MPQPSTPITQTTSLSPQTGTWRHPRLDEIVIRQNKSSFDKHNIKRIVFNSGVIVVSFYTAPKLARIFTLCTHDNTLLNQYTRYLYYFIQLILVYNIFMACLPIFRQKDDLADIPLTPAQRKLLGLPPLSVAPTPGSKFNTPPKYPRTSTPISGSPISRERQIGISSSEKDSPSVENSAGSPIFVRNRIGGDRKQRLSFGSSLSPSYSGSYDIPVTPTPSVFKGGISLNSKWLYDKRRRSSGTSTIQT